MNKYIKAIFCVSLAGIKYAILKLEMEKDSVHLFLQLYLHLQKLQ